MKRSKSTLLPNGRVHPRFAGLLTFLRVPRLEDLSAEHAPADWAIYGAPFDGGTTFRPGARFGPRAVRDASQYVKAFHLELQVDWAAALSVVDAGDAPTAPFSCEANAQMMTAHARTIGAPSTKLLAVGGDHSIALANMRVAFERAGRPEGGLAVLHFDAHLDTVDRVWGEAYSHASPFRRAIEEGIIAPTKMLSIGTRGPITMEADLEWCKAQGIEIVSSQAAINSNAGLQAVERCVAKAGGQPMYLSIDIDVLDPAFAPGTGTPVAGGLSSARLFEHLRAAKGIQLAGADVVEVLPDRDTSGITALAAAHCLAEILAIDASSRA